MLRSKSARNVHGAELLRNGAERNREAQVFYFVGRRIRLIHRAKRTTMSLAYAILVSYS